MQFESVVKSHQIVLCEDFPKVHVLDRSGC
jgi:hypothetical protein